MAIDEQLFVLLIICNKFKPLILEKSILVYLVEYVSMLNFLIVKLS